MGRYVMANRRAGKFRDDEKAASRAALGGVLGGVTANADIVCDRAPDDATARRVVIFEADSAEMAARTHEMPPDVFLEPEILHWVSPMDFLGVGHFIPSNSTGVGKTVSMRVTVRGSGPLRGARVSLYLRAPGGLRSRLDGITGAKGSVTFRFGDFFHASAAVVAPAADFWSVVVRGLAGNPIVECPALPSAAGRLGWWHQSAGISEYQGSRGSGIRVGVIDTGVGPHPSLNHVHDIGAFINGDVLPDEGRDVDSHGSHVCGIIGARPRRQAQFAGIAPGVELRSARVFAAGSAANQGDIATAIDELSARDRVDLINMSLGARTQSPLELDAIRDAEERGTLCVCAAGNSAGPPEWPAAFAETVGVSALGRLGWGPPGTTAAAALPLTPERFGDDNLYLANFSCFGAGVDCAGPGVGIISTVPERFGLSAPYASMEGTSMASPVACATLAARLAQSNEYLGLPRDGSRTAMARLIHRRGCLDIGLDSALQGKGLPSVG